MLHAILHIESRIALHFEKKTLVVSTIAEVDTRAATILPARLRAMLHRERNISLLLVRIIAYTSITRAIHCEIITKEK